MKSKKQMLFVLVSLLAALTFSVCATAATTVVSGKATFIHGGIYKAYNFGGAPDFEVTENAVGPRYALIQWDLSGVTLAANQRAANVRIRLNHAWGQVGSFSGGMISRITQSWIEGTAPGVYPYPEGPATDGSVTWNNAPAMVGVAYASDDYNSGWHNISGGDGLDGLVTNWIRGNVQNYGVQLRHEEFAVDDAEGYSSDDANSPLRPQLVFDIVAQTVATQEIVVSEKAAFVHGNAALKGNNYGADAEIELTQNADGPRHSLIQWNLAGYSLAAGQTVNATIRVKHASGDVNSIVVYESNAPWVEGTGTIAVPTTTGVTWNNEPNSYFVGNVDNYSGGWHNLTSEELNLLVEAWIRGTLPNNGVSLRWADSSDPAQWEALYSDDSVIPDDRPQLVFTIVPASSKKVVFSDKATYIHQNRSNNDNKRNFGGKTSIQLTQNLGAIRTAVVQWNLSGYSIPSGSSVYDAKIKFRHMSGTAELFNGGLSKLTLGSWIEGVGTQDWFESTQNGGTASPLATDGSLTWKVNYGVLDDSNTLGFTAVATNPDNYDTVSGWHELSGPAVNALVQGWISGTMPNIGVAVNHMVTSNVVEELYSDDGSFFGNWPKLEFSIRPAQCGDPNYQPSEYDLSGDCKVNFVDYILLTEDWLKSTLPVPAIGTTKTIFADKGTFVHAHRNASGSENWQLYNYGGRTSMEICQSDTCIDAYNWGGSPRRAFVGWDLSQFGKTIQISNVKIIFTKAYSQDQMSTFPTLDLSMEKLTSGWVEGTQADAPAADASFCTYLNQPTIDGYERVCPSAEDPNGSVVWQSVAVVDWYGAEAIEPPDTNYVFEGPAVTALVQGWIANPAQNFGVALATHDPNGEGEYCFLGLYSDDAFGDKAQYRPRIEFEVTGCGENPYLIDDFNKDCSVNLEDLHDFADTWLQCTAPTCP